MALGLAPIPARRRVRDRRGDRERRRPLGHLRLCADRERNPDPRVVLVDRLAAEWAVREALLRVVDGPVAELHRVVAARVGEVDLAGEQHVAGLHRQHDRHLAALAGRDAPWADADDRSHERREVPTDRDGLGLATRDLSDALGPHVIDSEFHVGLLGTTDDDVDHRPLGSRRRASGLDHRGLDLALGSTDGRQGQRRDGGESEVSDRHLGGTPGGFGGRRSPSRTLHPTVRIGCRTPTDRAHRSLPTGTPGADGRSPNRISVTDARIPPPTVRIAESVRRPCIERVLGVGRLPRHADCPDSP